MNILTKVFIVLQAIFSVALAVLVAAFNGSQNNLKSQLTALQTASIAQAAAVSAAQGQVALLHDSYNRTKDEGAKALAASQAKSDQLTVQVQDLASRLDQATLTNASQATNITVLTNSVDALRQQSGAKDTELAQLRPENVKLTQQLGDITRELNTTRTARDLAERTVRELKEALAAAEEKPAAGAAGPGASAAPDNSTVNAAVQGSPTAVTINGSVTAVKDVNGKKYVSLSLGSRDGVRQGTRFTVYRNNTYVADLVVQTVQPEESLGVVTITKPGQTVSTNDLVISGPKM